MVDDVDEPDVLQDRARVSTSAKWRAIRHETRRAASISWAASNKPQRN